VFVARELLKASVGVEEHCQLRRGSQGRAPCELVLDLTPRESPEIRRLKFYKKYFKN